MRYPQRAQIYWKDLEVNVYESIYLQPGDVVTGCTLMLHHGAMIYWLEGAEFTHNDVLIGSKKSYSTGGPSL